MTIQHELSLGKRQESSFREFVVGKADMTVDTLGRPIAIEHSPQYLHVLDRQKKAVVNVNLETGEFTNVVDYRAGPLVNPVGLFVDNMGLIYVVDQGRREVLVFNERDEFEQSYNTIDAAEPVDVIVTEDHLFVSDINKSQIVILDKVTGQLINSLGGVGEQAGLFYKPTYMDIDEAGNLAVVDSMNNQVQIIDQNGNFLNKIGQLRGGLGGMIRPKGISFDRSGLIYTTDSAFENVTIWQLDTGVPVLPFAQSTGPGGVYMPVDTDVDYDNVRYFQRFVHPDFDIEYLIYVANALSGVNVYGFGKWTGPLRASSRQQTREKEAPPLSSAPPALEDIVEEGVEE